MQGRPSTAEFSSSHRSNPTATFAAECGLRGPLRFMVENTETEQSQTFDVFEPFVLIGRSPGCHLQLLHPEVCYRHAYCQVVLGRLYVFDLDSQHGTAWGAGLRREGPLTPDSRLQIGPFVIRLSRAPAFTRSLEPTAEDWELENEPLENERLWFENATGRGSQSALRPLRRQITILGRSNRCHLKLSDTSVSKAHCAIVRTGMGYWVVDLLGRSATTLNDRCVRFAPVGPADRVGVGRFRVRIRKLLQNEADEVVHTARSAAQDSDSTDSLEARESADSLGAPTSPADDATACQNLIQAHERLSLHAGRPPTGPFDAAPAGSDALILAMMEQFSHLQQQLLTHTQQQMSMLTEMFATLHKAQNDAVMDQLNRIQTISSELNALRAERSPAPSTTVAATLELRLPDVEIQAKPVAASVEAEDAESESVVSSAAAMDAGVVGEAQDADSDAEPLAALPDDSDVFPVSAAAEAELPCDAETQRLESEIAARDNAHPESAENTAAMPNLLRRLPVAAAPRHDATAHARLTMRISELERERNSRWKRLMQLVGGALEE